MIIMQGMTDKFNEAHPDITLNWVTLEENILRERVTTDIATSGGQYDVVTIGNYEVPIWAAQGWLTPLDDLPDDYNVDDLLPAIRGGLTRTRTRSTPCRSTANRRSPCIAPTCLEKAGMEMPESPTWAFIGEAARAMTDRDAEINGICLRGKAGWGENMAFITALANSYGARWFDADWKPQLDSPEWKEAFNFYVDVMKDAGPAGRLVERLQREPDAVPAGQVRHVDGRQRRGGLRDRPGFDHRRQRRFRAVPDQGGRRQPRQLAVVVEPRDPGAARRTPTPPRPSSSWATSQDYADARRRQAGLGLGASGHPHLALREPDYQEVAPVRRASRSTAMQAADITNPSVQEVPYTGGQFVAIPEWQSIGTTVGQIFSAAVAGQILGRRRAGAGPVDRDPEMTRAGYIK